MSSWSIFSNQSYISTCLGSGGGLLKKLSKTQERLCLLLHEGDQLHSLLLNDSNSVSDRNLLQVIILFIAILLQSLYGGEAVDRQTIKGDGVISVEEPFVSLTSFVRTCSWDQIKRCKDNSGIKNRLVYWYDKLRELPHSVVFKRQSLKLGEPSLVEMSSLLLKTTYLECKKISGALKLSTGATSYFCELRDGQIVQSIGSSKQCEVVCSSLKSFFFSGKLWPLRP